MSISNSDAMKLLFGLDESGPTSVRVNVGALGADHNLNPATASGTPGEGVPTATDGRNGRAAIVSQDPNLGGTWTDEWRWLLGKVEANDGPHSARPALPLTDAADDFAVGVRFKPVAPYTEGIADEDMNILWAYGLTNGSVPYLGFGYKWQDDTDESLGARLYVITPESGASGYEVSDQGAAPFGTVTGSPADWYLQPEKWYRVVWRLYYDGSTGMIFKVYILDEDAGTLYTFTYDDVADTSDWNGSSNDAAWFVGYNNDGSGGAAFTTAFAHVDEVWLYDAALSDSEATTTALSGLTIPWTEPDYYRAGHICYSTLAKENADYPVPRPLPTGITAPRHPMNLHCQELRARIEGWRAGRPWALRECDIIFDPAGPFGSHRARQGERPQLNAGVWRSPGDKPWGACEDARGVDFSGRGPRRRRGFKIRRDVDSGETVYGFNFFRTWRSYSDELFMLYKVGTKLYKEDGASASQLDTGWNATDVPVTFFLDNRLVILSTSRQRLWDGSTSTNPLGVAAPASISALAGSGGTLNGSYYYAVTFYDPTTTDESAPVVTSSVVTPSTQKVTLTLPSSAPETRFTKYRIYRTVDGGTAPNFFLIDTVDIASTYEDTGEADGVDLIDQVTDSAGVFLGYISGSAPDSFALGIEHKERAIYARGSTNPERVYITEAGKMNRWYASNFISASGPVRAITSWNGRVVIHTDNTVEFLEGDFGRDADGNLNIQRTVISRSTGAFGQHCVVVYQSQIFWMDNRGVFTIRGSECIPVTEKIEDLFPYINTNLGAQIVGGWNHMSRQLWWTLPCADFQDDSSRMQTQFCMPIDQPDKWWFHDLEATFVGQFDDDLNGIRFGLIDHAGIFKELESYEGDGQEGDEAGTWESDDGIASITDAVVTVSGSPAWTTDEHRGKGVVLRDVSTGLIYYYTIIANGADSLTLERPANAALAADDGYYIGGMNSYAAFAAHDFGTPNVKIARQVKYLFADLTREELYL